MVYEVITHQQVTKAQRYFVEATSPEEARNIVKNQEYRACEYDGKLTNAWEGEEKIIDIRETKYKWETQVGYGPVLNVTDKS